MNNRHHMDHFRGAKLLRNGEIVLDDFEGYLACHEKSNHRKHWHGYFLVPESLHLEEGLSYHLVLADKREGDINLGELQGCQASGGAHAVDFHVIGDFVVGGKRRGLESQRHGISY